MSNLLKFVFTSDWHLDYNIKRNRKARLNLDQLVEYTQEEKIDGLLHGGDVFERMQDFGNSDTGVQTALEYLDIFSKTTKGVFVVKGNNSHDPENSINLLHQYRQNIFAFETNSFVAINSIDQPMIFRAGEDIDFPVDIKYLVQFLPYPTKANIITNKSIDEENANFIQVYDELLTYNGLVTNKLKEKQPLAASIALFHGNVANCKLQNGQPLIGQDLIVPAETLEKTNADFIGCGHIHLMQMLKKHIWYSGSAYNGNFGELEKKGFLVVTFEDGKLVEVKPTYFKASRPMLQVEAEFREGKFYYNQDIPENPELKFIYTLEQEDRALLTKEVLADLKSKFPDDAEFEPRVIPSKREVRNQEINHLPTVPDEVKKFAEITEFEVTPSLMEKVDKLLTKHRHTVKSGE